LYEDFCLGEGSIGGTGGIFGDETNRLGAFRPRTRFP
jgi:hypothetical protein